MTSGPGATPDPVAGPDQGRVPAPEPVRAYPDLVPQAHLHLQVPVSEPDPVVGEDRILTVPNLITLARLLCLPLYLWLLLARDHRAAAAVLLAVLGATDWADGYVARHFHQVSTLGKIMDPVADRLLFFVAIGGIIAVDGAPRWFSIAVLAREVVVSVATLGLAALGAKRIDVTWFGKAGTFGLMVAFPLFLGGTSDLALAPVLWALGWAAGIPGIVLAYWALILYVPMAGRALREGRAERAARRRAGHAVRNGPETGLPAAPPDTAAG
jgi:cardiolipin synthase (CMP-forming)